MGDGSGGTVMGKECRGRGGGGRGQHHKPWSCLVVGRRCSVRALEEGAGKKTREKRDVGGPYEEEMEARKRSVREGM